MARIAHLGNSSIMRLQAEVQVHRLQERNNHLSEKLEQVTGVTSLPPPSTESVQRKRVHIMHMCAVPSAALLSIHGNTS
jgi:hypothetical protein